MPPKQQYEAPDSAEDSPPCTTEGHSRPALSEVFTNGRFLDTTKDVVRDAAAGARRCQGVVQVQEPDNVRAAMEPGHEDREDRSNES